MIEIKVPSATIEEGQVFRSLAIEAAVLDMDRHLVEDGAYTVYTDKNPTSLFYEKVSPMVVAGVVQVSGTVTGYVTYIKMTKTYADATDVPGHVPGATYEDENNNTITRKWSELAPVHEYTVEGVDYVVKEGTDGQTYWDGSVIAQLYAVDAASSDVELMTKTQFTAWRPEEVE